MIEDAEAVVGVLLAEQRDTIDREPFKAYSLKAIPQHRENGFAAVAVEPVRECHVEAKFFHDIGITPAFQIFTLPGR